MAWTATDAPAWWPALTAYVTQLHEAWHAWMAWGREQHPLLTVVWAMLAGGAPLHAERLAARGGSERTDLFSFYDVSSYGLGAIDAMAQRGGRRPARPRLRPAGRRPARAAAGARAGAPGERDLRAPGGGGGMSEPDLEALVADLMARPGGRGST